MAAALTAIQACIASKLGERIVLHLWGETGIAGRVALVRNDYCVIDSDGADLVVSYSDIHSVGLEVEGEEASDG